jgi:flavin reductase (DIM6/NTAB) family NADH-FMN oxidoreductase RutF
LSVPLPEAGVGPVPEGRDPEEYERQRRRVLWSMPTGLFVVGSSDGERRNLMTANWVMQVATAPKLVAFAVETGSLTRELVERGGGFSVSILGKEERSLVRRFVKPVADIELGDDGSVVSMAGEAVREVTGALPCVAAALAWLSCDVHRVVEWERAGNAPASHVLVVGEVVDVGEWRETVGVTDALAMSDTRMNYGG